MKIVDVNLTSEGRAKLQLGDSVAFSYEVVWKTSDTKFEVTAGQQCCGAGPFLTGSGFFFGRLRLLL